MMLNREPFTPKDLANEVVNSFRPMAESARKKLQLTVAEGLPPMEGDRVLLARVLGNLISNALRHTSVGKGDIAVSLERRNEQLLVEVRDNGQGIPPEYLTRIFEKFTQVERQSANLRTGTGLGLTFCKMVVEAHGGQIFAHSVPNEGSTFTFLLPIKAPSPAPFPEGAVLASSAK